jgi:hypothetical protein
VGAGLVGTVGIVSVIPAFAVHEPDVFGVLPKLLALVPIPAAHELVSLQLVASVQRGQPALLYGPHELSQLSVVPRPLKLASAKAAFVNPGIGHPAASTSRTPATVAAAQISPSPIDELPRNHIANTRYCNLCA